MEIQIAGKRTVVVERALAAPRRHVLERVDYPF